MAGNRFVIPTYNPDFIGASQAAQARNYQKYRDSYGDLINAFNSLGAVGRDYSNRKFTEEQAEKQRQFQAEEAAKARQFQAAQHEKDLAAQAAWNGQIREQEAAKLKAEQDARDQVAYAELLNKDHSVANDLLLEQIRKRNPAVDEYDTGETVPYIFPNAGQPVKGSIYNDVMKQREADAVYQMDLAKFRSELPKTLKTDKDKAQYITAIRDSNFKPEDKAKLYDQINGIETGQTQTKKAVQGAVASHAGKKTTENLTSADAKAEANKYVGQKMNSMQFNKLPEEVRKHLKRAADNTISLK